MKSKPKRCTKFTEFHQLISMCVCVLQRMHANNILPAFGAIYLGLDIQVIHLCNLLWKTHKCLNAFNSHSHAPCT